MNTNKHIDEDDLALFALALMPPEEAAYSLAHLKHCDLCRGEVARMQGDLVGYAMTAPMEAPPPQARERFLAAIAKEKRFVPKAPTAVEPVLASRSTDLLDRGTGRGASTYETPARRGMGFFGWAGWAVAAGVTAVAGWQFHQQSYLRDQISAQTATIEQVNGDAARAQRVLQTLTDPGAMQVALHLPATPGSTPKPEAHASYNAGRGELVFIATHLQAVPSDKTYQLWLLPANGEAPVSAGLFKPDLRGNASVVLPELPKHIAAKGFGVTIEDQGGSKAPTPPIILAGV